MSSSLEALLKLTGYTSLEKLKSMNGLPLLGMRLTSLPESIGQLTNLTVLFLSDNRLTSVPESIGNLTNLTRLELSINQLSSLPESIGKLTNLTGLGLSVNKLSSLPEFIGQLTNLTELWIHDNQLSSLPEFIGQLTNLTSLFIYENQLSSLPESIGQLTNLRMLLINNNPITELPESITRLKNLKKFQIECWGRIIIQRAPIGITALPCYSYSEALKTLKLYKYDNENLTDFNSLIGKWKACDRINISNNKISTLPVQLSTLTDLCDFNIANNMLAMFPDVLLKMSWLTSLNIAGNSFTELPEGITKLAKLANLEITVRKDTLTLPFAPDALSTLPCYQTSLSLSNLSRYVLPGPSQPPASLGLPADFQVNILPKAPVYFVTNSLGEGGQATVYKGIYEGKFVAVKAIKTGAVSMKNAADEVILTKKIPHQNIVNIIGVYLSPQGMLIVMELGSDSLKGMIEKRKGPLTPFEVVTFGSQIAGALNYCVTHNTKEPMHHCDLKTENVLIVNGQAKLADFGLAHTRQRTGFSSCAIGTKDGAGADGTPHWQGPEIYNVACKSNADTEELGAENVGHRGEMSDVFAFGLLLWSMATGKYPFVNIPSGQVPPLLLQGERPDIPADVHPTLAHIIRACWRQNYKKRPRFRKVVAVLSMCGAGNLDVVPKEDLQQFVPIRYSSIPDMYSGELYEYLTEQGVPQSIAHKLRAKPMTGELFATYNAKKFVDTFKINEAEAQQLVSLQTLAPPLQKQESAPQVPVVPTSPPTEKKSVIIKSEPSTPEAKSQVSQPPAAGRPIPPKPIAEMDTDELVAFLKGQPGVFDIFLSCLKQEQISGATFLTMLGPEDLADEPFNLKGFQLKATLKTIEELKLL